MIISGLLRITATVAEWLLQKGGGLSEGRASRLFWRRGRSGGWGRSTARRDPGWPGFDAARTQSPPHPQQYASASPPLQHPAHTLSTSRAMEISRTPPISVAYSPRPFSSSQLQLLLLDSLCGWGGLGETGLGGVGWGGAGEAEKLEFGGRKQLEFGGRAQGSERRWGGEPAFGTGGRKLRFFRTSAATDAACCLSPVPTRSSARPHHHSHPRHRPPPTSFSSSDLSPISHPILPIRAHPQTALADGRGLLRSGWARGCGRGEEGTAGGGGEEVGGGKQTGGYNGRW